MLSDTPIGDFKHLEIKHFKSLKIAPSDKNIIQTVSYNSRKKINLDYKIVNDTLEIIGDAVEQGTVHTLFIKSEIESISSKNSTIYFSGIKQDNILINISNSKINDAISPIEPSYFYRAEINSKLSGISFRNTKVDTVKINLEKSQASFTQDLNLLKGNVDNLSRLNMGHVSNLKLEKDKGGKINIR